MTSDLDVTAHVCVLQYDPLLYVWCCVDCSALVTDEQLQRRSGHE